MVNVLDGLFDFYLKKKSLETSATGPSQVDSTRGETIAEIKTETDMQTNRQKTRRTTMQTNRQKTRRTTMQSKITNKSITLTLRKFIFQKYSCCQYKSHATGQICGSKYKLEIEHLNPRWAGGGNDPNNLTILCSNHNKFKYKQQKGQVLAPSSHKQ